MFGSQCLFVSNIKITRISTEEDLNIIPTYLTKIKLASFVLIDQF